MEEVKEFPFRFHQFKYTVTLHCSERFCHSSSPYHLLTTELLTYLGNTVPYLWHTFYYLHGVVLEHDIIPPCELF